MSYSLIPVMGCIYLGLLGAGCMSQDSIGDDEPIGASEEAVVSSNRLSLNGLALSTQQLRQLSSQALTQRAGELAQTPLLQSQMGRQLLSFVVKCALPEGSR